MTPQEALDLAVQHHQAGRLREAERIYRQILSQNPADAQAMHLLGVLGHQIGRSEEAAELIQRAISIFPNVLFYSNLGTVLSALKRRDEAIAAHRKAVELDPSSADAHSNFAAALSENGVFEEAAQEYRKSLSLRPDHAETHCNLGNVLRQLGKLDEALTELRQALSLRPNFAEAYNNLGNVWHSKGDFDQAILAYRNSVAIRPDWADNRYNLGLALERKGRLDEAQKEFEKAAELRPDHADTHYQIGSVLHLRGLLHEAAAQYRRAIELQPDHAAAHNNLGLYFSELTQVDAAIAQYRKVLQLLPDFAGAHNNLGNALKDTGRMSEAIECYRRSLAIEPNSLVAGNMLYTMHFDPSFDAARLAQEHAQWNRTYGRPLAAQIRPHENDPSPERRLRIGYVSHDFREHPVGRFIAPLLAHHDHQAFEVFGYGGVTRTDAITYRLRGYCDVWKDMVGVSNPELAERIREDRIDILIDLAMHMDGTRMLTFARKPAPVQVTYLAYVSTTGLETMDYRFTDSYLDPPGVDESVYVEKSIRLAHSYWCYEAPENAPAVSDLPALSARHVTFGCLNNFAKASDQARAAWTTIMQQVPASHLVLHCGEGSHRQRVLDEFSSKGIEPPRLRFLARLSLVEYLRQYQQIDIALDPFPYSGGTTTCDALWMGIPVVTLAAQSAFARGGVSILSNAGLPHLIADNTDQYIQLATSQAQDLAALADLRAKLREKLACSQLMNAPQFARDVEQAYRRMWREWCDKRNPTLAGC